jgi:hypothetical protein
VSGGQAVHWRSADAVPAADCCVPGAQFCQFEQDAALVVVLN